MARIVLRALFVLTGLSLVVLTITSIKNFSGSGSSQLAQVACSQGDLSCGLVVWWKLDDGSGATATDSSGNTYAANLVNAPAWVSGKFNGALSFNGTNQVMSAPSGLPSLGDFTVSMWINPSSNTGNHVIWETDDGGTYIDLVQQYSYTQIAINNNGQGGAPNIPSSSGWTHVVITRAGSTGTVYVNGSPFGSTWNAGTNPVSFASMAIAAQPHNWGYWFTGAIDDVRLYNRALSASDVTSLYQGSSSTSQGGSTSAAPIISGVTTSNMTSSGATISWITDTAASSQILYGPTTSYGSQTSADNTLVTSHSQSVSGLSAQTTYHYAVISTNSGGTTQSSDQTFTTTGTVTSAVLPTTNGLTGDWAFDEGTGSTETDSSGGNNTGVVSGTLWTTGHVGPYALSFNGTSDHVHITPFSPTAAAFLSPMSGDYTVSAWVKIAAATGSGSSQSVWNIYGANANNTLDLSIISNNGQFARIAFRDGSGVRVSATGATNIPLNTWTHILGMKSGSAYSIYVNGALDGSSNASLGSINTSDGNGPWISCNSLDGSACFHGSIDDVRIYNRALTLSEIQGIYSFTGPTAITPTPARNIPPLMSNTGPNGFLPAGTNQATLTVTTDEAATCKYGTVAGTPFSSLPSTFSSTGGTTHTTPVAVSQGINYTYYMRCQDSLGNTDSADQTATFSVLAAADSSISSGGIIPADRVVDWTKAGIPGGIPARGTICSTLNASQYGNGSQDASPAIQNAINSCPDNSVVLLSSGTFLIGSNLVIKHPAVLRGSGAGNTTLNLGVWCAISMGAANACSYPGSISVADWTGGLTKGSTMITLSSTAGLSIGEELVLDELNDPAIVNVNAGNGGSVCTSCGRNGTSFDGGNQRVLQQMVKIVAINGNSVTIDQPIHYTHLASLQPQAWTYGGNVQNIGLEDMYINENSHGNAINMAFCSSCWITGVRTSNNARNAVSLLYVYQSDITNNFFSGGTAIGPGNYAVELNSSHSNLIQNNIIDQDGPILSTTPAAGNVIAYNFITRAPLQPGGPMAGNIYTHAPFADMNLFEGNVASQIDLDDTWGSSGYNTIFRNNLTGYEAGATGQETPIIIEAWNRYVNVVGNVLGTAGFHNKYEQAFTSYTPDAFHNIYTLAYMCTFAGSGGACTSSDITVGEDPSTYWTLLRHGNYDAVSGTVKWEPVISNHALPPSLYLSAKPSWFGTLQWPAIGPDVTPMAGTIPAEQCYSSQNLATDAASFSPDICYSTNSQTGGTTAPPPPTTDTTPPAVSITAPVNASTVSGASVPISVTATDNVAISTVQLKVDGTDLPNGLLTTPTSANTYSGTWDTTSTGNISHVITAIATDSSGNTTTSQAITVTVSNVQPTSSPIPTPTATPINPTPVATTTTSTTSTGGGGSGGGGGGTSTPPPVIASGGGGGGIGTFTPAVPQKPAITPTKPCVSTASAIPASALTLTIGTRGVAVTNLQTFLVLQGYLDKQYITGYYGNLTKAALASYQANHPTSTCNNQDTRNNNQTNSNIPSFTRSLTIGATGTDVKYLQIFLNGHGFTVASVGNGSKGHETTYFGPATTKAVAALQRAYGITPAYGYFGPLTRAKINAMR